MSFYDFYDYDYDDYYYDYGFKNRYVPDYSSIKQVTEWMKSNMCFGLGIGKVCEFLKTLEVEKHDDVAAMYRQAVLAERESAGAKYGGGSYSMKESHINSLLKLCRKWRDEHAHKTGLPDLEARIAQVEKNSKNEKKKKKKINALRNTTVYAYDSKENELKFTKEYSGLRVAQYIYYFKLPGCEQISFHSNLDVSSGDDNMNWDGKQDSTLLKLNCAIVQRYSEEIKQHFSIDDNVYDSFVSITEKIRSLCRNTFTHRTYEFMIAFVLDKLFIEKDTLLKGFRASDMFNKLSLEEMSARLPQTPEGDVFRKLAHYLAMLSVISKTSSTLPASWTRLFTGLTEEIKTLIDKANSETGMTNVLYADDEDTTSVKIANDTIKLINHHPQTDVELFEAASFTHSFSKLESIIFNRFAKEYFTIEYNRHIEAEAYRERLRLARIEEENRKKEEERQKKLKEVLTYDFFTKSMLKEYFFWTDALIKKFAGEPDQTKPNPIYKCADPMTLYSKERIFKIEQTPEFVTELKKSFKRRKMEWPYENDVIEHEKE